MVDGNRYWNKLPGGQRSIGRSTTETPRDNGESEIENGNWTRWGVGTKRQSRGKAGRCRLG